MDEDDQESCRQPEDLLSEDSEIERTENSSIDIGTGDRANYSLVGWFLESLDRGKRERETSPCPSGADFFAISRWFHGRLCRSVAEDRLRETPESPCRYLVRESDSRPGTFVFSCLTPQGFQHFRITAVCGNFFIGGEKFGSLEELVSCFVAGDDHEEAVLVASPIAVAPTPCRVLATLPFSGMPDTDELTFSKGDVFLVIQELEDGWFWARNERSGSSGLVFQKLTENLKSSDLPVEELPYFHPALSANGIASALASASHGGFLVKASDSNTGCFTLLVKNGNRVEKFLISRRASGKVEIGGRCFPSLEEIVDRYRTVEIRAGLRLGTPVFRKLEVAAEEEQTCGQVQMHYKRLSSRSSCPDAIKSGFLWKKKKTHKKWKSVYVMLKDADGQLFCFENEKRAKPRFILDLCYYFLYPVHPSLFGRPNCFQLIVNGLRQAGCYFCAEEEVDYQNWTSLLRPLCSGLPQSPSPFTSIRTYSPSTKSIRHLMHLRLRVMEAKNLALRTPMDCYCVVCVNGAKLAKTMCMPSADCVVWDEDFCLAGFRSSTNLAVQVILFSRTKTRARDQVLGSISLCDLEPGTPLEGWFSLDSANRASSDSVCSLRVRVLRRECLVMPLEEYNSLRELLTAEDFLVADWLGRVCQDDRDSLSSSLLNLCSQENLSLRFLTAELSREIEATDDPRTLFRGSSFCTSLLNQYLKKVAQSYVTATLRPVMKKILEVKPCLEIQAGRGEEAVLHSNALQLVCLAQEVARAIFSSLESLPQCLRFLFAYLKRRVARKWPREPTLKLRAVGSFLFLRLFCVAVVDPRKYHLIEDSLSVNSSRNLVLIAKLLQSLANLSDSAALNLQLSELEPIKRFLESTKEPMRSFLNEVSSSCPEPAEGEQRVGEAAEDLATVFQIAFGHLERLQERLGERGSPRVPETVLWQLVSVLQLLSFHQTRYLQPSVS